MKKISVPVILFCLFGAAAMAQTVTVTYSGTPWCAGDSHDIAWTASGVSGDVRLRLFKGDAVVGNIAFAVPVNSSPFHWVVGSLEGGVPVSPGTGYVIGVRIGTGAVFKGPAFEIKAAGTCGGGGNTPPVAGFTLNPASGTTATNFAVDASASHDAETAAAALQVRWSWGDGTPPTVWSTVKTASHAYAANGSYTITLEVKDGGAPALTAGTSRPVTVGSGGIPLKKLDKLFAHIAPFTFISPTRDSVWTIGQKVEVRWKADFSVAYPVRVFLVSKDHKRPIMDMGTYPHIHAVDEPPAPHEGNLHWIVTDNLYDQEYCVRLTSADGKKETHSAPFWIHATARRQFAVEPKIVVNKYHWHNVVSGDIWPGKKFAPGLADIPDPGGTIIKYGYQRWYEDDDNYGRQLHRSYVFYDLAPVLARLRGKATVVKAYINPQTAPNSPQVCASQILCLDAALNYGDPANLFGPTFAAFPKHPLTADQQIQIVMAQRWLDEPGKNFGVVFCAANEGQKNENGQCVRFCTAVLHLEVEEKLNK